MRKEDYSQLKKQVEEKYKQAIELAIKQRTEELAAIKIVWEMFHKPRRKRRQTVESQQQTASASGLPLPASKRIYGILTDSVKKSLAFVPEEFTCRHTMVVLKQISDNPFNYSSVSNRLRRMAKEGVIEIVKQGHGKSPSIYRIKNARAADNVTTEGKRL